MDIQRTNAATKIQSLTRRHLARKSIKQQKQNNAATKIQSVYRGHKVRKDLAQNQDYILRKALYKWVNEAPEEENTFRQDAGLSFSKLPDEMLNEVCSFLPFKDRRSLTETAKQFSPLETGPIQTQSLGTTILQQLATDESIQWINGQLKLVGQNPIELIKKIANKEVVIPDYLVKKL